MNQRQKPLTFSLIIPVYNEQDYLENCLQSVKNQTFKPKQVIVVDNNSTDSTVEIARKFDFVTVISEKRQHQAYAQHTGFNHATGDIIGRIDADTLLPDTWVEKYTKAFRDNPDTVGITGTGTAYDIVLKSFGKLVHRFYNNLAAGLAGHELMWGSNCAFRKTAWQKISGDILLRTDIWEDFDLGFCLGKHGKIINIKDNEVAISYRSIHTPPLQQLRYHAKSVNTFSLRRDRITTITFSLIWSSILLMGPIILIDYYLLRPIKNTPTARLLLDRLSLLFNPYN